MDELITSDLAMVTTLRANSLEPVRMEMRTGYAVWVFRRTQPINNIEENYQQGRALIEPREYNMILKETRDQLYGFLKSQNVPIPQRPASFRSSSK